MFSRPPAAEVSYIKPLAPEPIKKFHFRRSSFFVGIVGRNEPGVQNFHRALGQSVAELNDVGA
jgi:hypothetical protein